MRNILTALMIIGIYIPFHLANAESENYTSWKEKFEGTRQELGATLTEQRNALLVDIYNYFDKEAYNYLRELLGESSVASWKDIDRTWVETQRQKLSQETTQQGLQSAKTTILSA